MTAPVEFGRLLIAPILADFLDAFPDITAELLTVDRVVNLAEEGIDVALRIGELRPSGLVALRVGHVRRVVCAAPEYVARKGAPKSPSDLAQHNVIAIASDPPNSEWRFGETQVQSVRLKPRLTVSNIGAALDLARQGWGITRALSYQVGPDVQAGALQLLMERYEPAPLPIHLVHQEGRRVPAKLRCFLDFARDRLRGMAILSRSGLKQQVNGGRPII